MSFASVDVVCAGIVVADHICSPIAHLPASGELVMSEQMVLTLGGCAANTATNLRKLNVNSAVAGRIGDDMFGEVVRHLLLQQQVDVSSLMATANRPTSQTMIINVVGEDRRFIHVFGSNADFKAEDLPLARILQAKVLYLGGYLLMPGLRPEPLVPIFQQIQAAGVRIVLDVATPQGAQHLAALQPLLPFVDVFLPNVDEAALILNEPDPLVQAQAFHELGAKTVVITMGAGGAILVNHQEKWKAGVYPIQVIDSTGSGDAFDAGYIYGMLKGAHAADCLRYASAMGASCVRAIGTTTGTFTAAECEAFLQANALPIEKCA